jgi:hypothetical protein
MYLGSTDLRYVWNYYTNVVLRTTPSFGNTRPNISEKTELQNWVKFLPFDEGSTRAKENIYSVNLKIWFNTDFCLRVDVDGQGLAFNDSIPTVWATWWGLGCGFWIISRASMWKNPKPLRVLNYNSINLIDRRHRRHQIAYTANGLRGKLLECQGNKNTRRDAVPSVKKQVL